MVRRSRLVAFGGAVAVLAAGGAVYVITRPGTASMRTGTAKPVVVPDVLRPVASTVAPDPADLATALGRRLHSAALGTTAALVIDGTTGKQLFAQHAGIALPPASTVKLLTAAAALTTLSNQEPLTTGVVRFGRTLYLVGGGDVTLTARPRAGYPEPATLSDLATQSVAALTGVGPMRLRYDAAGWFGPVLARGWSPTYLSSGNISRLSPLELDEARLAKGATTPRAPDPARQAALAFRRALVARGAAVRGRVVAASAPAAGLGIAAVESPSIPALVQRMLTDSDNDLAEALGREVARQLGQPATFAGAAAAVTAAIRRLDVPSRGLRLYDASGLSRDDRVTPRTLVAVLLLAVRGSPTLAPLLAGLPVAGFTGTLADRFRHRVTGPAAGRVRAKTGTLAGVNALAGQVVDADGRLLVYAFLASQVPSPSAGEHALDRLASTVAACGCRGQP
jgi:D-alanyl-D-alanine carboxypeptidase/D-alanyl-D-alanine-endopeptidase (penicillin-binding protein 4)